MQKFLALAHQHSDFAKGMIASIIGFASTFVPAFTTALKILLLLLTIAYTGWKFHRDYYKNKSKDEQDPD